MRRSSIAAFLLLATCLSAGAAPQFMFPWQSPNPDGNIATPSIAVGFFMDAVGLGLFAGASAAAGFSYGATIGLYAGGCVLFTGGAVLMTLGVDKRHRTLEDMGYTITTTHRSLSKTLGWVTIGCEVGALGVLAAVGDSLAGAIIAVIIGGAGATVEVVNMYLIRRLWLADINSSIEGKTAQPAKKSARHSAVTIAPLMGLGYDAASGRAAPYLGLSLGL